MSGNGLSINIIPPDPTRHTFPGADTYAGIAMFQARSDASKVTYSTNGTINFQGTFYYPAALADITSGGSANLARLIAYRFNISGHGTTTIDASSGASSGSNVFLVR
jgi:hypothetical protein